MSVVGRWRYTVRGYFGAKGSGPDGWMSTATAHSTEESRDSEIEALRGLMALGEISAIEVTSHEAPRGTRLIKPQGAMTVTTI